MRFRTKILWTILLTTQLWPLIIVGIEVHEPSTENTTENEDLSLVGTTESVTLPPTDNGMTVPEAVVPEEIPTSSEHSIFQFKENDDIPKPTVSSSILFDFPGNHKNFTPSPYLGTLETPPLLDQYNKYRQQYKEYYEQKSQYNQKPVKFEENSAKNHYISHNLNSYLEPDHVKKIVEQVRYKHRPFPYAYDHEKLPQASYEQTNFGTSAGDSHLPHEHHVVEHGSHGGHHDHHDHHEHNEHLAAEHKIPADIKPFDHNIFSGFEHHLQGGGEHHVEPQHKTGSTWKKVLRMLTTLVPLGLFIATLTPNILNINSTLPQKPSRQRSLDELGIEFTEEDLKDPLVQLVQEYGLESLDDPQCEDKIFCEMSRMGQKETSNFIQKGFWYLANETPDDMAHKVGMKELFKAIRNGTCDMYKCTPKNKRIKEKAEPVKQEKKFKSEVKFIRKKKILKEKQI